jgi:anti-anti-sigma regulatory factor
MAPVARPHLRAVPRRDGHAAFSIRDRFTIGEARPFCAAVTRAVARGVRSISVDMRDVAAADTAGLAALLQSQRTVAAAGRRFAVVPGPRSERHLVDARIVEELEIASEADAGETLRAATEPTVVAAAGRVMLRQPRLEDAATFRAWGGDGFLEQMVGSQLLYRCRHLADDDRGVLELTAHDSRAITAVV